MNYGSFASQNGQILSLIEIFCNLLLFVKYLAIYHCFGTQVHESRVLHRTRVYENQISKKCDMVTKVDLTFYNLKFYMELEFLTNLNKWEINSDSYVSISLIFFSHFIVFT